MSFLVKLTGNSPRNHIMDILMQQVSDTDFDKDRITFFTFFRKFVNNYLIFNNLCSIFSP